MSAFSQGRQRLIDQVIEHEGIRLRPYTDTAGKLTIGIGRNLTDKGLSSAEAMMLLAHDLDEAISDLTSFPWFAELNEVRQRALVDMRFNLGPGRFRGFRQMLHALERGDFEQAAKRMLLSEWATQVGRRARRLSAMVQTGKDRNDE